MTNITLFAQIINQLDKNLIRKLTAQYQTDRHNKGYNTWNHLVAMLFCQFANSTSVRDISNGLRSATGNLNHLGIKTAPSKSSISYQNKKRDWRFFQELYYSMYHRFSKQGGKSKLKLKSKKYLLDSSIISLCLNLFDWAHYRQHKGAIKLHTLLDYDQGLPKYLHITDGKTGDNKAAFHIPIEAGSVVVADRFYNDFTLLSNWDSKNVNFVVRHKSNLKFTVLEELDLPENMEGNILIDQIIELDNKKYNNKLRRVAIWDEINQKTIEILTNQLSWTASTISKLYKSRWSIEIFFREIKQQLHIKSFIGISENAVMIQIWTALITILILKYLKKKAKYGWNMSNLVAFLRLNIFVKIDLQKWLDTPYEILPLPYKIGTQGVLFK